MKQITKINQAVGKVIKNIGFVDGIDDCERGVISIVFADDSFILINPTAEFYHSTDIEVEKELITLDVTPKPSKYFCLYDSKSRNNWLRDLKLIDNEQHSKNELHIEEAERLSKSLRNKVEEEEERKEYERLKEKFKD